MSVDLKFTSVKIPEIIPYEDFIWFITNNNKDDNTLDKSRNIIHKLWNNIRLVELLAILLNTHNGLNYIKYDKNLKKAIIREIEICMRDISIVWTTNKYENKNDAIKLECNIKDILLSNKKLNNSYINDITSQIFVDNINKNLIEHPEIYKEIYVFHDDFMMLYSYLLYMNRFDKFYETQIKNLK
jgi:hypothetical protein